MTATVSGGLDSSHETRVDQATVASAMSAADQPSASLMSLCRCEGVYDWDGELRN